MIFSGGANKFETGLLSCESKKGDCTQTKPTAGCKGSNCEKLCENVGESYTYSSVFTCKDSKKICCIGASKSP